MTDKLRSWLICLLAGKCMIVLNCEVRESIHSKSGQGELVKDNHFTAVKDVWTEAELQNKLRNERELLAGFPVILKEREEIILKAYNKAKEE